MGVRVEERASNIDVFFEFGFCMVFDRGDVASNDLSECTW